MSWDIELAKLFKDRDNTTPIGALIGDVINNNPFKISILGNKVILDNSNSYVCRSALSIEIGDKVLCVPTVDGQTFFIVDKVVV